jgi:hypothetical protein
MMDEVVKYLKALVSLQAHALSLQENPVKPEILLARSGLKHAEIANILGKTPMAVAKSLSRSN